MWCLLFKQKEHYTNTVKCSVSTLCLHIQLYHILFANPLKLLLYFRKQFHRKIGLNKICSRRLFIEKQKL